jgi:hypothetical protein
VLSGRFGDTSHRPYIEALLYLPRLGVSGTVSFLVDTGADNTFIMPTDARTIGVDYASLNPPVSGGVSANAEIMEHREDAVLVFTDGDSLFGYFVEVGILPWDERMQRVPSLLGRDIIHRWTMHYQHSSRQLTFQVESADVSTPAPGPFPSPGHRYE